MARSPLGVSAVACPACGAKLREDRIRCLRCGQSLVARKVGRPPVRDARRTRLLAGAGALSAAALIGIVSLQPRTQAVVNTSSASKPQTAAPSAPEPPVRVAATVRDVAAPGIAAYASGDVKSALQQFRDAVALAPDNGEALNNLGQLLVRDGRAAEAVLYFDRAIAASPDVWAYRFNRARALGLLEQWGRAVDGYRDALRLFPEDYVTLFNLGKALQKDGNIPAAIEAFERAIRLAPGQADFHLSHGLALEAAEQPKAAANAYRRFLELADGSAEADKVKGRIALLEGPAATPR